jgi:hypothetical protein
MASPPRSRSHASICDTDTWLTSRRATVLIRIVTTARPGRRVRAPVRARAPVRLSRRWASREPERLPRPRARVPVAPERLPRPAHPRARAPCARCARCAREPGRSSSALMCAGEGEGGGMRAAVAACQRLRGFGGRERRAMALARHSASCLTVLGGRSRRVSVSSSFWSFLAAGFGAVDLDAIREGCGPAAKGAASPSWRDRQGAPPTQAFSAWTRHSEYRAARAYAFGAHEIETGTNNGTPSASRHSRLRVATRPRRLAWPLDAIT